MSENIDMSDGRDAALVRMAIRKRWPIPDDVKERLINKAAEALDGECDPRAIGQLGRVILAAEGQNQADEHLDDKNKRLDSGQVTERFDVVTPEAMKEAERLIGELYNDVAEDVE